MTQKKLSTLFLTLVAIFVVSFFEKNAPAFFPTKERVTPTPSPKVSQNKIVLGSTNSAQLKQTVKVIRVIDGDTIEIEGGETIRYIGIDTPETKHPTRGVECFGKEAALKNKQLVEGKEIIIEKDVSETDRYGRLLRYVYVGTTFVNDALVRDGYAVAATFPPDVKYQELFREAENEARIRNRGLWSSCNK